MKELFHLARLKKGGETFEVDVDPDLAIAFRAGKIDDVRQVLKAIKVFKDAKKGLLASEVQMKSVFGTSDPLEVAEQIIKKGDLQVSQSHRDALREKKRRQVLSKIQKFAIDPRTKAPHTFQRLESAFNQVKIKVDEFKNVDDQIQSVISQLRSVMPISLEEKKMCIQIPVEFVGQVKNVISRFAKIESENWTAENYEVKISVPGGLVVELFDRLQSITKGNMITKEEK